MVDSCTHTGAHGRSWFGALIRGMIGAVILVILTGAAVILYGMNIADRKTHDLAGFAQTTFKNLPELQKALPPFLADAVSDERRPDYRNQVDVSARVTVAPGQHGRPSSLKPVVEVRNRGAEVISLLSIRIVVFGEGNAPIAEMNEWAATPIAADRDWRGPLLPGSTAYVVGRCFDNPERALGGNLRVDATITDLRIWKKPVELSASATPVPPESRAGDVSSSGPSPANKAASPTPSAPAAAVRPAATAEG